MGLTVQLYADPARGIARSLAFVFLSNGSLQGYARAILCGLGKLSSGRELCLLLLIIGVWALGGIPHRPAGEGDEAQNHGHPGKWETGAGASDDSALVGGVCCNQRESQSQPTLALSGIVAVQFGSELLVGAGQLGARSGFLVLEGVCNLRKGLALEVGK